jgi:hypothetical protein
VVGVGSRRLDHTEDAMYSIGHPNMALRIARQKIDEEVRDAEARRIARVVRREARASSGTRALRRRRIWPGSVGTAHPTGGA